MLIDLYKNIGGLEYDKTACVVADRSYEYNCIAHAVGMMAPCIWPGKSKTSFYENEFGYTVFWPNDLSNSKSLENFVKFFNKFGFEQCEDDTLEPDYQKIAVFCIPGTDLVTHAATMHNNGIWTSKMGWGHVIVHKLYSLEGAEYGKVRCFLKRPWTLYNSEINKTVINSYWKKYQLGESIYKEWDNKICID